MSDDDLDREIEDPLDPQAEAQRRKWAADFAARTAEQAGELRDPSLPPEHIGQLEAGHERDEEVRRRKDDLAEKGEAAGESAGSIPSDAFKPEREILDKFDPYSGDFVVTHPVPGQRYVLVHADETTIQRYRSMGFRFVEGNAKSEAHESRGQHKAAGTSYRGVGDCLLMKIDIARSKAIDAHYLKKQRAQEGAFDELEDEANERLLRHGGALHSRPDDPLLRRTVLRGTYGQIERLNRGLKTGFGKED